MTPTLTEKSATADRGTEPAPGVGWALGSLSLCILLSSLGISIANVALPTLVHSFAASFQNVQWVVLAYLLAMTILIVSVGRLGDTEGRRKLLLVGIFLFTASSVLCGVAPTLELLITARAAQGLGAAIMMALAMASVGDTVPKARMGSAMGVMGTMSAIGTALGPSLGGLLIAGMGWRAIFFVKVPLAIVALVLARRCLPEGRPAQTHDASRFDVVGTVLLALTLAAYALAMTMGRGHFGALNVALLVAAAVGVGLFLRAETKAPAPLIHLAMVRDPMLRASLAMSALVMTVMMATLVVGPFYLSRAQGLGAAAVGLVMSAGPVVSALSGVPSGRIVDRFGTQRTTVIGLTSLTTGSLMLALIPASVGFVGYIAALVVMTMGYALFQAANNTAVMKDVRPERRGVVSGMLNLSRNLGAITGTAVMGAVFAFAASTLDVAAASPSAAATGLHITFAVGAVVTAGAVALAVRSKILATRRAQPATS